MKQLLFEPFDLGKWFVIGFTAWLAGLLDGNGGGGGGRANGEKEDAVEGGQSAEEFTQEALQWAQANVVLLIVIGAAMLLVLAIIVTLLWVSSRGKFMLLDNVIHNRAQVKAPWHQFRTQGNSLFLWRLAFGLIVMFVVLLSVGAFVVLPLITLGGASAIVLIPGIAALLAIMLGIAYIAILLEDFVVPLMHRDALTTNDAWARLLQIHRASPGHFVLYALWRFLLGIAAVFCVVIFGLCTCCVGLLIMVIPYLGAVLLLPVSVFFRLLGPEFLRQFGKEYDVFVSVTEASKGV